MTTTIIRKQLTIYLCAVAFISCGNNREKEFAEFQMKIDSLEAANNTLFEQHKDVSEFLDIINESLDSIAEQEHFILYSDKGIEGRRRTRAEQKQRLKEFADFLARQRERIALLEDSLSNKGEDFGKFSRLISYLNKQLDDKNRMIASLQKELETGKKQISSLSEKVEKLTSTNEALQEAVVVQTEIINEGYFFVGSKNELKSAGILSGGGLFSKKKLNISNFAGAGFTKVDISKFTELTINSPSIKVLTSIPANSYRIDQEGNQCKLTITDPSTFWSVSNYLVIQTK